MNLKQVVCKECGNNFEGTRTGLCPECSKKHKLERQLRKCPICGSKHYSFEFCPNRNFCKSHKLNVFKFLIQHFGFDKNKLGTPQVFSEFNRVKSNLERVYNERGLSFRQISALYNANVDNQKMKWLFDDLDIKLHNSIEEDLTKSKLVTNDYSYVRQGTHETWDGETVYLRSALELEFARQLDNYKVKYDTEAFSVEYYDTQQQKYRKAKPDFYLPETNTIVEIKSDFTLDIQNMKDKAKAYREAGYNFKLRLNKKFVEGF